MTSEIDGTGKDDRRYRELLDKAYRSPEEDLNRLLPELYTDEIQNLKDNSKTPEELSERLAGFLNIVLLKAGSYAKDHKSWRSYHQRTREIAETFGHLVPHEYEVAITRLVQQIARARSPFNAGNPTYRSSTT